VVRTVITVDTERCTGCGECVSLCHRGAIELSGGVARLVADRLCDGLGLCVAACPQGALILDRRQAEPFAGSYVSNPGRQANSVEPTPAAEDPAQEILLHRLVLCCRASQCGRLCANLIKQPGKTGVWCVDVASGQKINLYHALANRHFRCPIGMF